MAIVPKKRILVYAAAGLVVLAVGAAGLFAMRPSQGGSTDGMALDLAGGIHAAAAAASTSSTAAGLFEVTTSTALPPASSTTEAALIYVQVAGAVRQPGVYRLPDGSRVFQAVLQAGGFTDEADQQAVPLASRVSDGCRLYVPKMGETVAGPVLAPGQASGSGGATTPSSGPVSLNSATVEELDSLPGIGPALAQRILSYRETDGPFTSIDQLGDVPGIGPAKLDQLRPLVTL